MSVAVEHADEISVGNEGRDSRATRHGCRVLVALLTVALATSAGATDTSRPLTGATPGTESGRDQVGLRIPVIVTLRASPHGAGGVALVRALQRTARTSQPWLARRLTSPGHPARQLWLINAVAGSIGPDGLSRLAGDPRVGSVAVDRAVQVASALSGPVLPSPGLGNWGIADIGASRVWSELGLNGQGITIGTIDSGVDPANPALAGRIARFRDFVGARLQPYDDNGHGTHTASTLVGVPVSGAPIGVAPGAKLIVAKALDGDGLGRSSALLAAAQWMTDPDGDPSTADWPSVVNSSWSSPNAGDPWFRALLANWRAIGIVPVFASGNSGTVGSPGSDSGVITVGADDDQHQVPEFSGRHEPVTRPDGSIVRKPELVAPGVSVVGGLAGGFAASTGTSMASPHVAGTVALMRQANPALTIDQVTRILIDTATDIGPPGPDTASGAGALNARAAVYAAAGRVLPAEAAATPFVAVPQPTAPTAAPVPRSVEETHPSVRARLVSVRLVSGHRVAVLTGQATAPLRATVQVFNHANGRLAFRLARALPSGSARIALPIRRPGRFDVRIQVLTPDGASVNLSRTVTVR